MDLDDSEFDRKLRADVAKIEAFEKRDHEIKLRPEVDQSSVSQARTAMGQVDRQLTNDARRRGGLLSMLMGGGRGGQGGQAGGGGGFLRGLAGGAGPGIMGIGPRAALIGAAAPLALGALPAAAAPLLGGGVGLAGAGVAALGAKALIGSKQDPGQLYAPAQQALKRLTDMVKTAAQPLVAPLQRVFHDLPQLIGLVGPALKQMFAGAATLIMPVVSSLAVMAHQVLPLLGQAFRAAAPLMAPLIMGLSHLLTGLLPGLISLLRAAQPAVRVFSQILGMLGRDIGSMLKDFAPVLRQSAVIFKALMDVVSALFPIIGQLAAIFAKALAPVFVLFAQVVKSLLPFLVLLGKILADFASAVIGDLVAVLKAVATLLKDLAPSFAILAGALGQVFKILENSGVFGILAAALEQIAPALAGMINALVRGLAPILPPLIKFLAQVVSLLAKGLAQAIVAVLPALTQLGLVVLQAIADLLPVLLPLFAELIGLLTPVFVRIIQDLATAFDAIISAIPPKTLEYIALGFLAIWAAIQIGGLIATVSNPVTLIAVAVGLLIVAIVELVKHWGTVWGFIKRIAEDVWKFLTHGWGQFIILPLFAIRKAVEFVRDHWKQAWDDIKGIGLAAWHVLRDNVFGPLSRIVTQTVPNAFATGAKAIGKAWEVIKDFVKKPVKFAIGVVIDGLIGAFDWVASHVGLGNPIKKVDVSGWQAGGRIPGFGGGDKHLALLESGEAVVSKETTAAHAAELSSWGVPGMQLGGLIGGIGHFLGSAWHKAEDIGKITAAVFSGNVKALTNAMRDMIPAGVGGAGADLARILTSAPNNLLHAAVRWLIDHASSDTGWPFPGGRKLSELRRIDEGQDMQYPGTSPVDVLAILPGHVTSHGGDPGGFGNLYPGLHLDRPAMGFRDIYYGHVRPAGRGGHVTAGQVLGRTMGPTSGGDAAGLPNWLEIGFWPPNWANGPAMHRLLMSKGGASGPGPANLIGLERVWTAQGGGAGTTAHIAAAIAMAESGGREVKQQGMPPGLTGWGLWQITPTSGITQNGRFGNLLNDANNARAAVYLWRQAHGFSPWSTYNSGAYQSFMDAGGWLSPGPNMVINATRRGEAVLTPSQSRAFIALSEAAEQFGRGAGTMGGGLMRDVHLTLPEGSTVAEALREISWLLRTSSQLGYTGVR